jgi:hypothetical protein
VADLLSALWLLGLFAAAPALRSSEEYGVADRLRDALIVGVAIPLMLGFLHLLYPIACWLTLALFIAIAVRRHARAASTAPSLPPYALIAALLAVAWPQLVRPLLDGDSLSYHLPNAASWVHAHSLWTPQTRYWWYPPASELFAAALYAVGSPFALPWSGFAALALLGSRIFAWARAVAAPHWLGDALAAATVTAFPLAIQGGTLQNDVWLAAFWVESLWSLGRLPVSVTALRSVAVTTLIKPQGWLLTALALVAYRARPTLWLAAGVAFGLWIAHDAALWRSALLAPASSGYAPAFGSSIIAHGVPALTIFVHVALAASPFALLAFAAALFGPAIEGGRARLGWSASAAAILFFLLPFGYTTGVAQLATGASLRFAAPAIAAGAVILVRPASRIVPFATTFFLACALFGIVRVLAIFWNDGSTHVALAVALLAPAVAAGAYRARSVWPAALAFGLAVVVATHLAARHPLDYYADALRVGSTTPTIYRWIAATRPDAVGGWGLRLGVVNIVSPSTQTMDLSDSDACLQARRNRVLLVAVAESDRAADANARRLQLGRACGQAVFEDPIGVAARP